jgi:hypothetical protein
MTRLIFFIISGMLFLVVGGVAGAQIKEIKFNFTATKKDWSIYGGWVNAYEPVNKGRLGSTQEWRIEKPKRHYY